MSAFRDYYKILRVSREASSQEIKRAFRHLARRFHPDLHPNDPAAPDKFRDLREAYEVLSDEGARHRYDRELDRVEATPGISPQVYYVRGVEKTLVRDYAGAIEEFTQAIALNPRFIEAYLRRCEARAQLGRDREVLGDCQQVLRMQPDCKKAYFYRGRARHKLGYIESAVEAYSRALSIESKYAQAFYYRGTAYYELRMRSEAIADWREYADLCREQGDTAGYKLAVETLNRAAWLPLGVGRVSVAAIATALQASCSDLTRSLWRLASDPVGGMLPAYASLEGRRAGGVGLGLALLGDVCFAGGVALAREGAGLAAEQALLLGAIAFGGVAGVSAIARGLARRSGSWTGDVFLAGAGLLPLGVLGLASGLPLPPALVAIAAAFAASYAVLMLYTGCTQIANLSEKAAALTVPTMVVVGGFCSYLGLVAMRL